MLQNHLSNAVQVARFRARLYSVAPAPTRTLGRGPAAGAAGLGCAGQGEDVGEPGPAFVQTAQLLLISRGRKQVTSDHQ